MQDISNAVYEVRQWQIIREEKNLRAFTVVLIGRRVILKHQAWTEPLSFN